MSDFREDRNSDQYTGHYYALLVSDNGKILDRIGAFQTRISHLQTHHILFGWASKPDPALL